MSDPITLLLIDDSTPARSTYRRLLLQDDRYNYTVIEFEDGRSALDWCQSNTADIILLDYLLPDLNGLEFLLALKQQWGDTLLPVAMLTAYGNTTIAVEAIKQGAQNYLDKSSITAESLYQCVHHVLEQVKLKRELAWQQEQQRLVAITALRIRQSLKLDEILDSAAQEFRSLLGTDRVLIYRFNPDWSGQIVVEAVGDGWSSVLGEVIDDGCFKNRWIKPYLQGRVSQVDNIHTSPIAGCYRELMLRFQVQANLVVPLIAGENLWGLLITHHCARPHAWHAREVDLLQRLANQLAIAIEQAELHEQLQRELIQRQQTELRFQALFEKSPEGKARFAPDGAVIAVNRSWKEIWQATPADFTEYNILRDSGFALNRDRVGVLRAFAGETVTFPPCLHDPAQFNRSGSARWVDLLMYPLKNHAGQLLEVVVLVRDCTDRMLAEQAQHQLMRQRHEHETRWRLLIKHAPVGIVMLDRELCYIASSQRWLDDYDLGDEKSNIGRSLYELFPEIPDRWRQIHQRCLAGAADQCDEDLFVRADGTESWVRWAIHPWYSADDTINGIILFTEDITIRKQATLHRQQLQHDTEIAFSHLQTIINNTPDLIAAIDVAYRYTAFNRAYQQEFETIVGRAIAVGDSVIEKLAHLPSDQETMVQLWQRALAGETFTVIQEFGDASRGRKVYELVFAPIGNGTTMPVGATHTIRNVTERVRVEEEQRQAEEKFRQLAEHINDVFWMSNGAVDEILYVNPAYEKVWGRSCDSLYADQRTFMDAIHPDDRPRVLANLPINATQPYQHEYRVVRPDGSISWVIDKIFPIRDGTGTIYRYCGIVQDITSLKQAEAQLQQANASLEAQIAAQTTALQAREQLLNAFFEAASTASVGLCILDQDLRYLKINEHLAAINGQSIEYHHGRSGREIVPTIATMMEPLLQQMLATNEPIPNLELAAPYPNQPERMGYWLASYFPIVQEGDRADAVGCIVLEIGDRKQIEQQLYHLNTQLQNSNKDLEQFALMASHDLKEPLRTIHNFSHLLQLTYGDVLDEKGKDYLHRLDQATQRMQALIDDLLQLSQVAIATTPFLPVDLNQVMEQVIANLQEQIQRTGGTIQVAPLPKVQADLGQITQLLQNLVSNALKFHRDIPPIVKIDIKHDASQLSSYHQGNTPTIQIYIEDNGIGFDPKDSDRIFSAFERLHGRTEYEGTGIGLAICKKIIEHHGGIITAQSTPGQGSTFILTLPAAIER